MSRVAPAHSITSASCDSDAWDGIVPGDPPRSLSLNATSISQDNLAYFNILHGSVGTESQTLIAARASELRNGAAEMRWAICNPLLGFRLFRSFVWLGLFALLLVILVFGYSTVICIVSSNIINSDKLKTACVLSSRQRISMDVIVDLRPVLLTVDVPMFVSLACCYCFGVVTTRSNCNPSFLRLGISVMWGSQICLALIGSLIVALADALWVWGAEGEVGFAGVWIFVMNFFGIAILVSCVSTTTEAGGVWKCMERFSLFVILLLSVTFVEAVFYVADSIRQSTIRPILCVGFIFSVVQVLEAILKLSFHRMQHLSPELCAYIMFSFQVGAYLSLRIYLQSLSDIGTTVLASGVAAIIEIACRVTVECVGKVLYNRAVRRARPARALRILDVFIFEMVTDILAEISCIAAAGALSLFINTHIFPGITAGNENRLSRLLCQLALELISDVVAVLIVLAILPISLEGLFERFRQSIVIFAFFGATMTYSLAYMNLRINIKCFN